MPMIRVLVEVTCKDCNGKAQASAPVAIPLDPQECIPKGWQWEGGDWSDEAGVLCFLCVDKKMKAAQAIGERYAEEQRKRRERNERARERRKAKWAGQ